MQIAYEEIYNSEKKILSISSLFYGNMFKLCSSSQKGDRQIINNYRPVSPLLTFRITFFEKILLNFIFEYLHF